MEARTSRLGPVVVALVVALLVLVVVFLRLAGGSDATADDQGVVPAAKVDRVPGSAEREVAVLAGGCFWGIEGVFEHLDGVTDAVSGYAGGPAGDASYYRVGSGSTGHAEAVQVTFDPRTISYGQLLRIYFSVAHDPTQLDRQGPDVGSQYRSTIFPTDTEQARIAEAYIHQLQSAKVFDASIVTTIEPDKRFYPAEAEHQNFMSRNPNHPYIVAHDRSKLVALQKLFPDQFRSGLPRTPDNN